ncbi:MAG TPA: M15 family peptidase, partial [Nocardioides sp.]|nr:M15 family peptidase [Nocardioides sp.]
MRVRRPRGSGRAAAATAVLVLLLGACSDDGTADDPDPTPAAETSTGKPKPAKEGTPAVPVADPEHAVDPPGEREGRLWSADILVQWDKAIDDDLLRQIEKLTGVAHTERIGLGQVSLENRVLTVASVDPGGYRNFTRADVADLQE